MKGIFFIIFMEWEREGKREDVPSRPAPPSLQQQGGVPPLFISRLSFGEAFDPRCREADLNRKASGFKNGLSNCLSNSAQLLLCAVSTCQVFTHDQSQ